MKILKNIQLLLNTDEILQLLSNKKTSSEKKQKTTLVEEINQAIKEALPLLQTKVLYDYFPSNVLKPRILFEKSEYTLLAICTIGNNLENKSSELMREGFLSKGVIYDAIASHATEMLADHVNQIVLTEIAAKFPTKNITRRFSPGYCQWSLEEGQRLIFSLLPAKKIDVKLSLSMMMIPRKSISFAINIGNEVDYKLGEKNYEIGEAEECLFRIREQQEFVK